MKMIKKVSFKLNGNQVEVEVDPLESLLNVLRNKLGITSAKEGCAKGECGACTVLLNDKPITSCLKLAFTLNTNDNVITVEGLNSDALMCKIQDAFIRKGAVQCGFCTPGMLISTYYLLKNVHNPTSEDIKKYLAGNLCRCTGYIKIEEAVKFAIKNL